MTARNLCGVLLLAAAVPLAAATAAAAALGAGHLEVHADRHHIEFQPQPRRSCPDCYGAGGWWTGGANPEMESCSCWATRPELRVRLLPAPARPEEPPF
ncbi:hypothetical protein OHA46_33795 (plasmid) [Streptomyces sp. NBC_00708]